MTAPIRPDSLPSSLGRTLTYEEFQQAKLMSPQALQSADFPAVPPIQPVKPAPVSAGDQIVSAGQQIWNVLSHPIDAVTALGHGIVDSARNAVAPVIGQKVGQGWALGPRDIAQIEKDLGHPLETVTKENTPNAVTPDESLTGTINTAANAILPGVAGAGSRIVNAGLGALNDPEQPIRGALVGLTLGELIHHASKVVGGAAVKTDAALGVSEAITAKMAPVNDAFKTIFAPASRTAESKAAANILRASTGTQAASYEQAAFKLDEFRRAIEPLPQVDKLAFINAIEGGKSQPSPAFQESANTIRSLLDDARDQIRALGTGKLDHFVTDYYPHIWTDPARATDAFALPSGQQAAMEGSKAFLKEREIPTTADGIALGLEPVSYNPVDLTMLKLREMQKYLMAHTSLTEMKENGLVKYVPVGEQAPDGYAKINDKIATVFGPKEGAVNVPEGAVKAITYEGGRRGMTSAEPLVPEDIGVPGLRIMGEHWAPEPVARVVNNSLAPGLRGNALYDAYRGLGNTLNQAQLGFSAFHLGMTSLDASVSRTALGLEYIASGKPVTGLAKIATSPFAPLAGIAQGTVGDLSNAQLGTNFQWGLGAKIRDAYLNPEKASPEMQALANAVKEAGGRVRQDSFYANSAPEKMVAAWKEGDYGKSALLSIPAALEYAAKPLMEHIVPLQKLGVFGEMAQKALADLPDGASLADRRAALSSAWDSVDNRMGQLVYDNLFWNKTFKDLAMGGVRSVGWNLGTIRELGGGAADLALAAGNVARGETATLTHRASYAVSLPIMVGMYGALYQYLRTGDGPSEFKDYYMPKTGEVDADGNPERVQLPTYMKDVFAYAGHPVNTVGHKFAPLLTGMYQMLQNQNYYGDEIRNPDDPAVKQLMQEAQFVGKTAIPFAMQNMMESSSRGDQSNATKFGNWFGITPAPREQVRSAAQNKMAEDLAQRQMSGATPEDAAARQSRAEILAGLRGNTNVDIQTAVTNAIEHEQLTGADLAKLLKRAGTTPAQEKFKRLTVQQAIEVFKLATPAEQGKFAEALIAKIERASAMAGAQ